MFRRLYSSKVKFQIQFFNFFFFSLVILPKEFANDFEEFCKNNHQACPVLEKSSAGDFEAKKICSKLSDVRTDLGKYRIYKKGELIEEISLKFL